MEETDNNFYTEEVINIGQATMRGIPVTQPLDFLLPGVDPSVKTSGSSVAAALATGLAALLLFLCKGNRHSSQNHYIRHAFQELAIQNSESNGKFVSTEYLFGWYQRNRGLGASTTQSELSQVLEEVNFYKGARRG